MHLFLARILVIDFGFLVALSIILMTDPRFTFEINNWEKHWNRGAVKCLDISIEGMVGYRRLGDFGDVKNL